MQFKIDTKPTYHTISTEIELFNANLADAAKELLLQYKDDEIKNFIFDLSKVNSIESHVGEALITLHEIVYNDFMGSLVFTNLQEDVLKKLKQDQVHLSINITPTMIEAVDIISMEVLERDLFNEL
jgi:anti-anti-sigma regulatory factor